MLHQGCFKSGGLVNMAIHIGFLGSSKYTISKSPILVRALDPFFSEYRFELLPHLFYVEHGVIVVVLGHLCGVFIHLAIIFGLVLCGCESGLGLFSDVLVCCSLMVETLIGALECKELADSVEIGSNIGFHGRTFFFLLHHLHEILTPCDILFDNLLIVRLQFSNLRVLLIKFSLLHDFCFSLSQHLIDAVDLASSLHPLVLCNYVVWMQAISYSFASLTTHHGALVFSLL